MSWRKQFLRSRFALTILGLTVRVLRPLYYAGLRWRTHRRLLALLRTREPVIFLCWHQDFVATVAYLSRFCVRRRMNALASASRDGGLAAAAAQALGIQEAVRGSSTGGGASALRQMTRLGVEGKPASMLVVGDGPRPPARVLKPGAIHLARELGLPIWLVRSSWSPERALRRTWAKFHVYFPWSRGVGASDGPIHVPPDLDRAGVERLRVELTARLNRLADATDAWAVRVHGP